MADQNNLEQYEDDIKATLEALGENYDSVDKITMKHLRKIEKAVADEVEKRELAIAEAKTHNLSVASVSKTSGVSHATFYNKPILSRYVNARKEILINRNTIDVADSLKKRLDEANRQLDAMQEQGAEIVQLHIENEKLKQRVRMLEVQLAGGTPAADGKGEVIPFEAITAMRSGKED